MRGPLAKLLPNLDGDKNVVREAWNLVAGLPGGKRLFSALIGRMAPYTGTIGARITALRPGFCQAQLDDRREVRNHLACVPALVSRDEFVAEVGNVAGAYQLQPIDANGKQCGDPPAMVFLPTPTAVEASPPPKPVVRSITIDDDPVEPEALRD